MGQRIVSLLAPIVVFTASLPLSGHHSLAELYDRDRIVTLEGTVTSISWVNPHVVFDLEVENERGVPEVWAVEVDPPNAMVRRGWNVDTLVVGMVVSMEGFASLDGSRRTEGLTVTLPGGESLIASTDGSWNWMRLDELPLLRFEQ